MSLNSKPENILLTLKKKEKAMSDLSKEVESLKIQLLSGAGGSDLFSNEESFDNGHALTLESIPSSNAKELRAISDKFTDKFNDKTLILLGEEGGKIAFIVKRHKKDERLNLSTLTRESFKSLGIRGGGKPDMIQGSIQADQKDIFISTLNKLIKEA